MTSPVAPIGPGRLVLIVGPSGAGKDTLIGEAKRILADDPTFVFPRRTVTRPPSDAEENDYAAPERFVELATSGAFAVTWEAHGLRYGLPRLIEDAVREGRTVVCNVSRTVIRDLRSRFAHVTTIEITAPRAILEQRLAARCRDTDGALSGRLGRVPAAGYGPPDVVIDNGGSRADAAAVLVGALRHAQPVLRIGS